MKFNKDLVEKYSKLTQEERLHSLVITFKIMNEKKMKLRGRYMTNDERDAFIDEFNGLIPGLENYGIRFTLDRSEISKIGMYMSK